MLATVAVAASAFAPLGGAATIAVPGLVGRNESDAKTVAEQGGLSIGTEESSARRRRTRPVW